MLFVHIYIAYMTRQWAMSSEVSFNGRSQCRKIIFKVDEIFENIKKCSKSSIFMAVWIFFVSAAPTAQNSPELKNFIRNMDQDTAVDYSVNTM
jgi:hypothetical protein